MAEWKEYRFVVKETYVKILAPRLFSFLLCQMVPTSQDCYACKMPRKAWHTAGTQEMVVTGFHHLQQLVSFSLTNNVYSAITSLIIAQNLA